MAITMSEARKRLELHRMKKYQPGKYQHMQREKRGKRKENEEKKELERYLKKEGRVNYLKNKYGGKL